MKQKGSPKTGGRTPGTPNRVTQELRLRIKNFLDARWEQFETDFNSLEVWQRLQLMERLLPYATPKMKESEITLNMETLTDAQLTQLLDAVIQTNEQPNISALSKDEAVTWITLSKKIRQ